MSHHERRNTRWTFYIIPDRPDADAFQWSVEKKWLYLTGGVLVFLVVASLTIGVHYYSLMNKYKVAQAKAKKYDDLRTEFEQVKNYAFRLQNDLDTMQQVVEKLQTMAGTLTGQPGPQATGTGGEDLSARRGIQRETLMEQKWVLAESQRQADMIKSRLRSIEFAFQQHAVALSSTPSISPVYGYIVSGFGTRLDPFTGAPEFHQGVDISAPYGTPVVAAADGVVIHAGRRGGYGKLVVVDHGMGIHTYYAHLSKVLVHRGERIKRWQIIGLVGSTGRSTSPHLHYEIRFRDTPLNPMRFMISQF